MFKTTVGRYQDLIFVNIENDKQAGECTLTFFPDNNKNYATPTITLNNTLIDFLSVNKIVNILIQEPISYDIERANCKLELHHNMLIKLI